jgi:glycerol-3-phosphate dehydrogenase (NAD(P)+)
MNHPIDTIAVIGAGAWGTALAMAAQRAGRRVTLVARRHEQADAMRGTRRNEAYLPGIALDPAIGIAALESPRGDATESQINDGSVATAIRDADAVLLVAPAQHLRATLERLRKNWTKAVPVLCSKGIERDTGLLMPELCAELLPDNPCVVLSGPNFAREVALDLPAAVTLAGGEARAVAALVNALGTRRFRPYASDDPIGAATGGAVKNVLAIAAGIVEGRGYGENARAAMITRALVEIRQLAKAKGGRKETPMGLSGLGDLLLTCTSLQSRNYSLGAALGEGRTLAEATAGKRGVVEGVETAAAIRALADRLGLDMPIAFAVDAILHRGAAIDETVGQLLGRPFRTELE